MKARNDFFCALAMSGAALGLEGASGRAIAMFYGQTADAGWLGILLSALLFGAAAALICDRGRWLQLRQSFLIRGLQGLFLLGAACMLLREAWHIGQLALPLHRAGLYGVLGALFLAAAAALSGQQGRRMHCCVFACMLAACLAALLFFGRMPEPARSYGLQLRLGNFLPGALLLALAHTAVGVFLSVGMAPPRAANCHPVRLGIFSSLIYGTLLSLGKGIFSRHEPMLLRLRCPFAALAAGWGKAGFYLICMLIFLGCTAGLSAILCAVIPKRKSPNFGENRC